MCTILILMLLSSNIILAQKEKVVESSSKAKPAWIGKSDNSAFSITETGLTLAEASECCISSVRQYIINSIAVNVSSSESMVINQISKDDLITAMSEYSSVLETEAGRLPYLNDISLSNAEDVYWEKIYNKTDKKYRYEYSVRYPFSEQTRRTLVEEFLTIDREKAGELERLRKELGTLTSLDGISQTLNDLNSLEVYFFDDVRKSEVDAVRNTYKGIYKRLSIVIEEEGPGYCVYSLHLDGRRVTTSVPPRLKSESAISMESRPYGDRMYRLTYDPSYASRFDLNQIEIIYLFGATTVTKTVMFDPSKQK